MPARKSSKATKAPASKTAAGKVAKAPTKKSAVGRATETTSKTKTDSPIYQIKVTLKDFKPTIWRRVQVSSDTTLGMLHVIIQMVMGWGGHHLHQFILGKRPYLIFIGSPSIFDENMDEGMQDEDGVRIKQALPAAKSKMTYEYDFGDGWEHEILLEKILHAEQGVYYPRCLAGEMSCPPDDVGGVWGYANFLDAIKNPKHPQHKDLLDWVGGKFDPEEFDLEYVNKNLKNLKRQLKFERELRDLFS
jgi:hypothetical protein